MELFTKRNDVLSKEIQTLQTTEADLLRRKSLSGKIRKQEFKIIPATQKILDSYPRLNTVEKISSGRSY